jgi:hypothetical protein
MKPFLQGKKTLAIEALRLPTSMNPGRVQQSAVPHIAPAHASSSGHGSPQVEAVKEGDKVVRLIVTCGCGERIEIECLYAGGA